MSERLQKFLARSGVASRRHAEEMIRQGRVSVNNQTVREMGTKVNPGDLVTVDGKLVAPPSEASYYIFYKPPGVVTTLEDPEGRPSIASYLRGVKARVFPVGRLDYDAEGALLLTDDGELANRLTHPRFQVRRTYLVKVKGAPNEASLVKLLGGVRLEDGPAQPLAVDVFEKAEKNTWLRIVVGEGRPHLVKRLVAAIGHPAVRLFRPAQGGISVERLRPGQLRPLTPEEIARVKRVANGEASPDPLLKLPARRHGHGEGERFGPPREPGPAQPVEGSEPRRGPHPNREAPKHRPPRGHRPSGPSTGPGRAGSAHKFFRPKGAGRRPPGRRG